MENQRSKVLTTGVVKMVRCMVTKYRRSGVCALSHAVQIFSGATAGPCETLGRMRGTDNACPTWKESSMAGALNGLRVLDLTSVLMGPFATQLMADMGADVIKIESPAGDTVRGIGPMRHAGMGSIFLYFIRKLRSLVLDVY
jgi:hypothetical protein